MPHDEIQIRTVPQKVAAAALLAGLAAAAGALLSVCCIGEVAFSGVVECLVFGGVIGILLIRKVAFWKLSVFSLIIVVFLVLDFERPTPPKESPLGSVPEFEAQLQQNDSQWQFVFEDGKTVSLRNIHGEVLRVLLNIGQFTNNSKSHVGDVRVSPDRRKLLVTYSDPPEPWAHKGGLLVLDVETGKVERATVSPIPAPGDPGQQPGEPFELDHDGVRWLGPSSLFTSWTHYPPEGGHLYKKKYLRFDLRNLATPEIIPFENHLPLGIREPVIKNPKIGFPVLFCGNVRGGVDGSREWKIGVVDEEGIRGATDDETHLFLQLYFHKYPNGPHKVEVRRVPLGFWSELDDKRYDPDRMRWDIFLSGKWVRRTDNSVEMEPTWEPELSLYVWSEYNREMSNSTFFMDAAGHYRWWGGGEFQGLIPRAHVPAK